MARQLEEELIRTKAQLRSVNEHHELQAEELKASNEELQAMNEELRSAAEELETGKEELQAINEELTTVNQELKVKVDEVSSTSNNLQNLINSTNIATLFLDRGSRLKLFTPATRQIFNLISSDVGRPLSDITNRLDYPHLMADTEAVLATLRPIEREVVTNDGSVFIMRVVPYRTSEDRISGLVLTFVDITDRIRAEQARRSSEEQFRLFVTASSNSIYKMSPDWRQMLDLQGMNFLADTSDPSSTWLEKYILQEDRPQVLAVIEQAIANKEMFEFEHRVIRVDGTSGWTFSRAVPLLDEQGDIIEWFGAASDITERRQAEEALRQSEEKYRTLFNSIDQGYFLCDVLFDDQGEHPDILYLDANPAATRMVGQDFTGRRLKEIDPNYESYWYEIFERVARTGQTEWLQQYAEPNKKWYDFHVFKVGNQPGRIAVVFVDSTERKRREEHTAFTTQLQEELGQIASWPELIRVAGARLGAYLKLDTYRFIAIDEPTDQAHTLASWQQSDTPPAPDTYRISRFLPAATRDSLRADRTVVVDQAQTSAETGSGTGDSFIAVPLCQSGTWKYLLWVAASEERHWRVDEVDLVSDLNRQLVARFELLRLEETRQLTLTQQTEELASIGSWEYYRQTGRFSWSAGMNKLLAMQPGQSIQPDIYLDVVVDEDWDKAQNLVSYLHEGKGRIETDLRIRTGALIKTLRIKADIIGEAEKERVLGVILDITAQLAAQQQIQETAENLQAVLNTSPASIGLLKAVHDEQNPLFILDFRLAVGNDKLAQFFDQPLNELLGQSAERFGSMLWDGETLAILRQVYDRRENRYEEKQLPAPNQDRWLAISVMQQDDGVMLTGLDITELKQVQSQRQHWLNELETLQHSADALATLRILFDQRKEQLRAISHDLRGNFGVIQGALHLLDMADTENDRAQMMDMVLRNVKQATDLLTNLLDLARLEAGQQERTLESFDAAELLRELGQSFQSVADAQGLRLTLSGPETLPVQNDRRLVYRMVQNLTINALKYTHQGSVTLNWGQEKNQWWFEVIDTGPGFNLALVVRLNTDEHDQDNPSPAESLPPSGSSQPDTVQTGSLQTGSLQTGSLQTGSLQTGSLQTGSLQTGSLQTGPNCRGKALVCGLCGS